MGKEEKLLLPSDLTINPDGTAILTLNEVGDVMGTYKGVFTFKCYLNPLEQLTVGKLYRELLGTNSEEATDTEKFIAVCLSQLSKRILKAPPFWDTREMVSGNIPDINILSLIFDRAVTAEMAYKEHLRDKKEQSLEIAKAAANTVQENLNNNPKKDL